MTDDKTPTTRQAVAAQDRSGKLTVSGKLKVALDEMLFKGSRRAEAAAAAGMTDHGLREAMKKVHVKRYYNAGLEVLRTSERARNISALAKVRDQSDNSMAVVSAAKALEQLAEPNGPGGRGGGRTGAGWAIDLSEPQLPGLVIVIRPREEASALPSKMIDVTPNDE
ncbi:hypothetical protein [Bradyrhizobium sp. LTSP885]|uniref:hypothetical protein n=1 Tax=Bradyrhizobium sp. LTSP885 TaxID=1619232 RepID=UPI000A6FEA44|nr:hypothetical protein [Bradyrhizobium sp. LTSP885]